MKPLVVHVRMIVALGTVSILSAAGVTQAGDGVTAGSFYVAIATARNLSAASAAEGEKALRSAGVPLPSIALNRELTEGDVVAIGRALGMSLSSRQPAAPFTSRQAAAFVSSFVGEISHAGASPAAPRDSGGQPNPNGSKGKGKKKGHHHSPCDPRDGDDDDDDQGDH